MTDALWVRRVDAYEAFMLAGLDVLSIEGPLSVEAVAGLRRSAEPVRLLGSDAVVDAVVELLAAADRRAKVQGQGSREAAHEFDIRLTQVRKVMRDNIER